jgi:hypothetical protein
MNKIKSVTTAVVTFTLLVGTSFSSSAMDRYVEQALVSVCKASMSNSVTKLHKTAKSYNLKEQTIALKVMCNGEDIITFAQQHGAYKTAARLENKIQKGKVSITDVAALTKMNVNFVE